MFLFGPVAESSNPEEVDLEIDLSVNDNHRIDEHGDAPEKRYGKPALNKLRKLSAKKVLASKFWLISTNLLISKNFLSKNRRCHCRCRRHSSCRRRNARSGRRNDRIATLVGAGSRRSLISNPSH